MKFFVTLAICIFLGTSCSNSKTINLESPQENELKPGEKFTIELPENHTTGYLWQLEKSYNSEQVDYMNSVWHGNDKGVYFNFKTSEKGKTELHFSLIKYKDTLDTKTFIIDVK